MVVDSLVVPKQEHTWKGHEYPVPATGTLRIVPDGAPRGLVHALALSRLRVMLDELYAGDDA